jgi:hypothetical protein
MKKQFFMKLISVESSLQKYKLPSSVLVLSAKAAKIDHLQNRVPLKRKECTCNACGSFCELDFNALFGIVIFVYSKKKL